MTSNGADGKQPLSDMELSPWPKVTPVIPLLRIELKKPVVKAFVPGAAASPKEPSPRRKAEPFTALRTEKQPEESGVTGLVLEPSDVASENLSPAGTDSVPTEVLGPVVSEAKPKSSEPFEGQGSKIEIVAVARSAVVKDEGEGKLPVIEDGEGGNLPKLSKRPSHEEAEGVAVESEVSKGQNRKTRARLVTTDEAMDNMGNRSRKGDPFCYVCGSPEHIARDCVASAGPYAGHPGMYGSGGPLPPGGIPPYTPDVYWHGPPLQHSRRPFPINYVEGIFGAGHGIMPFDHPMMPTGLYCIPPYMPPIYPGGSHHEGFLGAGGVGLMQPMERPLSREEFIELLERERVRWLMQDRHERAWSPERLAARDATGRLQTADSERRTHISANMLPVVEDRRMKDTGVCPNESNHLRKASKQERKHFVERLLDCGGAHHRTSDNDYSSRDDYQELQRKQHRGKKSATAEVKKDSTWSKQHNLGNLSSDSVRRDERKSRDEEAPFKRNKQVHSRHIDDARSGDEDVQSSKDKGTRLTLEDPKPRSHREGLEDVGKEEVRSVTSGRWTGSDSEDAVRSRRRKHRSDSKARGDVEVYEHESEDDDRKRKKRQKKRSGNTLDHRRDKVDVDSVEVLEQHQSHKSPSLLDHPRWELGRESSQNNHSEHKHHRQRNGRAKLPS